MEEKNIVSMVGHHGTTSQACDRIMKSDFTLTPIDKGWFGQGVYFFEDDKNLAYEWVKKEKSGKIPKVIEADIEVPAINFLNLTDVKSCDYEIFKKVRDEKVKAILNENNIKIREVKHFEALVMNILKKDADIFVVKVPSLTKTQDMKDTAAKMRIPNCNEVVVFERRYIKSKKVIGSEKYE
ncbi:MULTISPECIES: hypothetical protein [Staphylococcus]|uniref:hypothetical protein n=1 Tax=Staphylococcus TaxID=1279 RepID=UPI0015D6AD0A|nr:MULTISPECIES: hypothetical protein [Staphylococcus]MBE7337488.1 hypothetical protein [Staphylococcus epidermidis]